MHLNVFMAHSGFCSRRKAALLIKSGKVTVNGKVVLEPWFDVKESDAVKVSKKPLHPKKKVYIVFNKPKGVTTTLEDRFASKKVTDFIPRHLGRLYPVGRLDKPSRGLLILTNDGDLCYRLTHPKFEIEKEYVVAVEGKVDSNIVGKLKKGVHSEEEVLKVKSAFIEKADSDISTIRVIVSEGKKRHLRRLLEYLDFVVLDLRRIRIGDLRLGDLREGSFKIIDKKTMYRLALSEEGNKSRP